MTSTLLDDKPILWTTSKKPLDILVKEDKEVFRKFKKSENHGDFGDSNGDANFASFMLYLHEIVYFYSGILAKIIGKLPERVFTKLNKTNS